MDFMGITRETRVLQADNGLLKRIYDAARVGLKGDALAYACNVLPEELGMLQQHDRLAKIAEQKGRADGEFASAKVIMDNIDAGNPEAALNMLRFAHGWASRQQIQIDTTEKISITLALQMADNRVNQLDTPKNGVTDTQILGPGGNGAYLPAIVPEITG
jgi:hypothetical protein